MPRGSAEELATDVVGRPHRDAHSEQGAGDGQGIGLRRGDRSQVDGGVGRAHGGNGSGDDGGTDLVHEEPFMVRVENAQAVHQPPGQGNSQVEVNDDRGAAITVFLDHFKRLIPIPDDAEFQRRHQRWRPSHITRDRTGVQELMRPRGLDKQAHD